MYNTEVIGKNLKKGKIPFRKEGDDLRLILTGERLKKLLKDLDGLGLASNNAVAHFVIKDTYEY